MFRVAQSLPWGRNARFAGDMAWAKDALLRASLRADLDMGSLGGQALHCPDHLLHAPGSVSVLPMNPYLLELGCDSGHGACRASNRTAPNSTIFKERL